MQVPNDILIIDDDQLLAQTVGQQLAALGYRARIAHDGAAGSHSYESGEFALVLLDLSLPDTTGVSLLRKWQAEGDPPGLKCPVVMVSGTGTIPSVVEAMQLGASDFLVKPVDMGILEAVVRRTLASQMLKHENLRLKHLTHEETPEFAGVSHAVQSLLAEARNAARGDQPVLLEGETGTGKQVLARFIHAQSSRASEPFVTVNCAAITETLFESELFGHEKGAFTGAISRKPGKLELVGQGTLFLDEIGEMPPASQAKLLTAVEDRVFERVGGVSVLRFEGRVLAATNRNLDQALAGGTFRRDMFFRLSAFRLRLPPLRERPEDIPVYIGRTLKQLARKYGRCVAPPDESILSKICSYAWPGNVRELIHHVERVVLSAEGPEVPPRLWLSFPSAFPAEVLETDEEDLRAATEGFKRRHVLNVLTRCGGNQTEAARHLGIERTHLNRMLAEYEGRR